MDQKEKRQLNGEDRFHAEIDFSSRGRRGRRVLNASVIIISVSAIVQITRLVLEWLGK